MQSKNSYMWLSFLMALSALMVVSPELLAVKDSTDAGLNASAKTLVDILDNTLIPVILVAGCIASIVYSFAIAQPKPFILSLVTLCGFGFARAWITGTYALIG